MLDSKIGLASNHALVCLDKRAVFYGSEFSRRAEICVSPKIKKGISFKMISCWSSFSKERIKEISCSYNK